MLLTVKCNTTKPPTNPIKMSTSSQSWHFDIFGSIFFLLHHMRFLYLVCAPWPAGVASIKVTTLYFINWFARSESPPKIRTFRITHGWPWTLHCIIVLATPPCLLINSQNLNLLIAWNPVQLTWIYLTKQTAFCGGILGVTSNTSRWWNWAHTYRIYVVKSVETWPKQIFNRQFSFAIFLW